MLLVLTQILFFWAFLFLNCIRKLHLLARLLNASYFFSWIVWQIFFSLFYTSMQWLFRTENTFITLRQCIFCSHPKMKMKMMVVVFAEQTRKVYFGFLLFFFPYILVLWFCPVQGVFILFRTNIFFIFPFKFLPSFLCLPQFLLVSLTVPLAVFFIWGTFIFDSFRFTHSSSQKI